jgi:hypothetical protein
MFYAPTGGLKNGRAMVVACRGQLKLEWYAEVDEVFHCSDSRNRFQFEGIQQEEKW